MMPVPNNPRLSEVQDEFDAPTSAKLSAFYRGGSYVPDAPVNDGVPASGELFLSDLVGAAATTNMTLTISGDPTPNGSCTAEDEPCTATTDSITCTVSGGTSPYVITTEKRPNYTEFDVIEGVQGEDSRTFEYRTTNTDSSATYNSQYRIKVVDSVGEIAHTAYFSVSNVHTYEYSDLVLEGSTTISSYYQEGVGPADGIAYGSYTITGGGAGVSTKDYEVISGSPYITASTTIIDDENDSFGIKLVCLTSGTGIPGPWSGSWVIRVTAERNGKSDSIDVNMAVGGIEV